MDDCCILNAYFNTILSHFKKDLFCDKPQKIKFNKIFLANKNSYVEISRFIYYL